MHRHEHTAEGDDRKLYLAVSINVLLTLAQIIGGVVSGSLSLIADALHNLGDAAGLAIAIFARRIGRLPANHFKTFGYKRAEIIAALINQTTLVITGLYLIYEAIWRFFQPEPIQGWLIVIIAAVALFIDTITALLTWRMSRESINIRAAFIHNVSDALASIGVMIAGTLILLYQWYWMDSLLTVLIAGYILYQGYLMLPETVHILMQGTPEHLSVTDLIRTTEQLEQVVSLHHVHVWQLDEHRNALEAHVVVTEHHLADIERIKQRIKQHLHDQYDIDHSTLEIELQDADPSCADHAADHGGHCRHG
jgi:cobalt-zinc-cadmium efflux system protein